MPDHIPDITVQVLDQPIGVALVDVAIAARALLEESANPVVRYHPDSVIGRMQKAVDDLDREARSARGRHGQLERFLKSRQ